MEENALLLSWVLRSDKLVPRKIMIVLSMLSLLFPFLIMYFFKVISNLKWIPSSKKKVAPKTNAKMK